MNERLHLRAIALEQRAERVAAAQGITVLQAIRRLRAEADAAAIIRKPSFRKAYAG